MKRLASLLMLAGCTSTQPVVDEPISDIVARQEYLIFHNLKRCWHNAPRVKWNAALAYSAKTWAQQCTYARDPSIAGKYGESIAVGPGLGRIKAQDNWYMQFLAFPYGKPDGTAYTQEFSQIVWKNTAEIGCADAVCPNGNYYVCRYAPGGNVAGQYAANVQWLVPTLFLCNGMN